MKKAKPQTPFQQGINDFLKRLGISQRKLAERIGRSNMAVSQWCLGNHEPKVGDLDVLIKEGMSAVELFGEPIAKMLLENTVRPQEPEIDDKTLLEIKKKAMEGAYKELFKERLLK
jgi:transcriptional regulator with XRE-family HTH domain